MINILGYHGTNKANSKKILSLKHFVSSRGDHHWLGDGIYFYYEATYAYKWNVNDMMKTYSSLPVTVMNLKDKYAVICVRIEIEDERLFDLSTLEHSLLYDYALDNIQEHLGSDADKYNDIITEGVVLNVLFDKIGFRSKFDAVCKVFYMRKNKYNEIMNYIPKQFGLPEKQLCLKNHDCIKEISLIDNEEDLKKFHKNFKSINKKLKC